MTSIDQLYKTMRTIRRFEERVIELVGSNEIAGVTHECIGQEAVATGVCAALRTDDVITSTHRGHGHVIAKGASVRGVMAELFGKVDGLNRGRGGSMHIADFSLGIYGANGIVAAGAPIATGAAWAAVQAGSGAVAATFFGDGGANQGVLHESMNLAALWKLPVIFVCENNGYAVTLSQAKSTAGSLQRRAEGYGMRAEWADGMDVEAVLETMSRAVAHARAGEGPSFLECRTYNYFGHTYAVERALKLSYRTEAEIQEWRERDPLALAATKIDEHARVRIDDEVEIVLDDAEAFARESPRPAPSDALDFVYASGMRVRDGVSV